MCIWCLTGWQRSLCLRRICRTSRRTVGVVSNEQAYSSWPGKIVYWYTVYIYIHVIHINIFIIYPNVWYFWYKIQVQTVGLEHWIKCNVIKFCEWRNIVESLGMLRYPLVNYTKQFQLFVASSVLRMQTWTFQLHPIE